MGWGVDRKATCAQPGSAPHCTHIGIFFKEEDQNARGHTIPSLFEVRMRFGSQRYNAEKRWKKIATYKHHICERGDSVDLCAFCKRPHTFLTLPSKA